MASNEAKVLDPAAPVDQLQKNAEGRAMNRRNLMAGLGIAGATLGAGLLSRRSAARPSVVEASTSIPTGFSEVDYLNFLLNIKYLLATFYSYVTQGVDLPGTNPQGFVAITTVAANASTATITAANTFNPGQTVILTGLTTATANVTGISATPTTVTITSPSSFSVGQTVIISGLTTATATITNVAATATTVTVTAANSFAAGQTSVVISGLTGILAGYNGTFTLASANATTFTIALASAGVASTAVTPGTAGAAISLAQYNGTFTIATATATNFTYSLASVIPVLGTVVPGGGLITIPVAQYNGTYAVVSSTTTNFTFAFTTPLPFGAAAPVGTAQVFAPNSPYTINGTAYYPAQGTAAITNPPGQAKSASNVVQATKITFSGANAAQLTDMINEIYYDELNQLINLQNLINSQVLVNGLPAVIGTGAIVRPAMNLGAVVVPITSPATPALTANGVLTALRYLEDLSVSAFAGVAQYLTGANLTAVTQIMAVDGLHSGALRLAIVQQNAATPGTDVNYVTDSDIVPAQPGAFWQVQADDVTPADPGTAALAASGPQIATTPALVSAAQSVQNPCTAPMVAVGSSTFCTPTQYQGFFTTAGAATASGSGTNTAYGGAYTPPGFAFARTPSQVLSILYGSTTGMPEAPPLPSPNTNPLGANNNEVQGGYFPSGVGGVITVITS